MYKFQPTALKSPPCKDIARIRVRREKGMALIVSLLILVLLSAEWIGRRRGGLR